MGTRVRLYQSTIPPNRYKPAHALLDVRILPLPILSPLTLGLLYGGSGWLLVIFGIRKADVDMHETSGR